MESVGSEYDQTAVLAELDRVLRSVNLAEKCYGIVKLPHYFERYPFPVFITAAFLKLVEAFRNGTNVTRKWILHVAERSEKHLDKVISRDELMKRILTVSHSNDPNARALTMKLFAYFARILSDRKQMHHLICTSLHSNDTGELRAAIFATQRFAKHSAEFGRSVLDKTTQMLLSIDVPPETKLLLVPIFQYFGLDVETCQKAIVFCRDQFLPQCHSSAITGALLGSLTKLAVNAVTVAPMHLQILLARLGSSTSSKRVTSMVLDCLHYLADQTPHLWTSQAIQVVCEFISGREENEGDKGLRVLATLTKSQVVRMWSEADLTCLVDLCSRYCYDQCNRVVSLACVIATNVIGNLERGSVYDQLMDTLVLSLTTALPIWPWASRDPLDLNAAKSLLRCALQVCKLDRSSGRTVSRVLVDVVRKRCSREPDECAYRAALSECVLGVCDAVDWSVVAEWPVVDGPLGDALLISPKPTVTDITTATVLAPLERCRDQQQDPWQCAAMGRRALRYGYARVAAACFDRLQLQSDHFRHWAKALASLARAEGILAALDDQPTVERLADAVYHNQLAAISMKAAGGSFPSLWFAVAFIQLRGRFLSAARELRTVWDAAVLVPPSLAVADGEPTDARLLSQLTGCEHRLAELSLDYESLARRCFDADDGTVDLLTLLRAQCFLVQRAVRAFTNSDEEESKPYRVASSAYNAQTRILSGHLEWMSGQVDALRRRKDPDRLLAMVDRIALQVPFFVPRFFFQSLQSSSIKLSVSPKPSDHRDQVIRLPSDQRLLVTVEGVVSVRGTRRFRTVDRVVVRVRAEHSASSSTDDKAKESRLELEKTVRPTNDYFWADFMLDFPSSGLVDVRTELVDAERGRVWDGAASERIRVKVLPVGGPLENRPPAKRHRV